MEFEQDARMTRLQLQQLEAELERLLRWRPKEKKHPISQGSKKTKAQLRRETMDNLPDLFDFRILPNRCQRSSAENYKAQNV